MTADDERMAHARRGRGVGGARFRRAKLLGPVVITAALALGPGSVLSAAAVGGSYGYDVLWLLAASAVFSFAFVDMGVRLGLVLQESPVQAIKKEIAGPVGVIVGAGYFIMAVLFLVGSALGAIIGLHLIFGGATQVWVVVVAAASLAIVWSRSGAYRRLEVVMIALIGVMLVAFVVTAFLTSPDWVTVGNGFIPSSLPTGVNILVVLALLATNVEIYTAFYAAYTVREKGTTRAQYRDTTLSDTLIGVLSPVLVVCLVIIAAATVLQGRSVESATDVADVLGAVVGPAGPYIFAVGIFAAGFSSVIGNMTAGGTIFADGMNLGSTLTARAVRVVGSVILLIGLVIILVAGQAPVELVIVVNALSLLILPFLAVIMLWMCNRRSLMGELKNRLGHNVLAVGGLVLVGWSAVQLIEGLFA